MFPRLLRQVADARIAALERQGSARKRWRTRRRTLLPRRVAPRRFVRPLVSRLQAIIDRVRVELTECPAARVETLVLARHPADRSSAQARCSDVRKRIRRWFDVVLQDDSRPVELVAGVAVQSFERRPSEAPRAITLGDLSSTDGETELWRFRRVGAGYRRRSRCCG